MMQAPFPLQVKRQKMNTLSHIPKYIQVSKQREQAQRIFHGRGHAYEGLKHVTVDWLPPVLLITLFDSEPLEAVNALTQQLLEQFPECRSVQLQHRYQLEGPIDLLHGEAVSELVIREGDVKFNLRLGQARNTGLFLDMQTGRQWVQAHCQGLRVLNLFSYTCGFSISALAGGAKSVVNVDMSRSALTVGRKNHRLNQQDLSAVSFEKVNIFNSFSRLKKRGPFDLLVCDPPTLQKGSVDIVRDYPKILRRLDQFMAAESTLVLCLNAPELGRDFLLDLMAELAPSYQLIDEIKPPDVYREAEAKGLKVLCFKRGLN